MLKVSGESNGKNMEATSLDVTLWLFGTGVGIPG